MRVIHDYNSKWINGKNFPLWHDVPNFTTEEEFIKNLYHERLYVYDSDNCGDSVNYFRFSNEKCFKLEYSWWIDYDDEEDLASGGNGWRIHNEYYITPIKFKHLSKEMQLGDRNWLI